MIVIYDRTQCIEWTPKAKASWEFIRETIRQCWTLHYVQKDAPEYLKTDASD